MTLIEARTAADAIIAGTAKFNATVAKEAGKVIAAKAAYWAARGQQTNRDNDRVRELALIASYH